MEVSEAWVLSVLDLKLDEMVRFLKECKGLMSRDVVVLVNQLVGDVL